MSDFATAHSAQVTLAQAIVSAAQSVPGQVTQIVVGDPPAAEADIKVDLREALSVVIETEEERVDAAADLSHDDVSELEQRRLDLVMWLLNLESRLAPYCADFA